MATSAWRPRVMVPLAFALTAAWLAYQAWHVNSYVWLVDELLYMKYAVSYSDFAGVMPHVHGVAYGAPNMLFPLLVAPLFWFLSAPDGFVAAHVLNGILFASTLFPVYLLSRRVGASWPWALLGGLVAVWLPWSVATLVMMTEATAYPAFAWAMLAIVLCVAEPRPRHDVLAVVAIALAILARTQLVFLVGVLPAALVLFELSRSNPPPWRERLRERRVLLGVALLGALVVAVVQLTGGNLIGSYEVTTTTSLLPGGLWGSMMVHVAHLVVGVTIVPALMWGAWLIATASRPRGAVESAAAIASALAFAALIHQAGWFSQTIGGGVTQERYVLYAAVLFAVGLAALGSRSDSPRASVLGVALVAAVAVGGSSFDIGLAAGAFGRVASAGAGLNEWFLRIQPELNAIVPGRDRTLPELAALATLLGGVVLAIAFTGRWRRYLLPAVCLVALLGSIGQTRWLFPKVITGIAEGYPNILTDVDREPRDWVDRSVPDGAMVGLLPGRLRTPNDGDFWMWTEFWNKRLTREYTLAGVGPFTGWPGDKLDLDPESGSITTGTEPDLLVVAPRDPTLGVRGRILRRSAYGPAIMRPEKPLQADWWLKDSEFDGAPRGPGRTSLLHVWAPQGAVAVTFQADGGDPELDEGRRLSFTVRDETGTTRRTLLNGTTRTVIVRGARARFHLPNVLLSGERDATVRVLSISRLY